METENCCTGCNRPDLPWAGRGTELPIAGCRFTLYPMSDKYIEIILGSLEKTDTSAVWSETDALSTVYRGKLPYVADAVQALFLNAYRPGVHMALEGQFSKGCPGDVSGDSKLTYEGEAPNHAIVEAATQPCLCKLALYPMGVGDYIDDIARVWRMAEDRGLNPQTPRASRAPSATSLPTSPTSASSWRPARASTTTCCTSRSTSTAPPSSRTKGDGLLWSRPVRCRRDQVNPSPLAPDAAGTR